MYPIKSLVESGVRVSFGSDWPVSEPNPLPALFGAVQRTQPSMQGSAGETEAINLAQALEAHSVSTAFQLGQESIIDQDWVELDRDISAGPAGNIMSAKVLRTCVAGKVVFQA
jgi:predicted amidohydrolase YtcJ